MMELDSDEERVYRTLFYASLSRKRPIPLLSWDELITEWLRWDKDETSRRRAFDLLRRLRDKGYISSEFGPFYIFDLKTCVDLDSKGVPGMSINDVFVIHGRDSRAVNSMKQLLRAVSLTPVEWEEAVSWTNKASPPLLDVIKTALERVQAAVVLFTPDEVAQLKEEFWDPGDTEADHKGFQPRQNVLIEAGMALALFPDRTLLVQIGKIRMPSDITGLNYLKFDGQPKSRTALINRLENAGCKPRTKGGDYLTGGFEYLG